MVAIASLLLGGLLPAQKVQNDLSAPLPQASDPSDVRLEQRFPPLPAGAQAQMAGVGAGDPSAAKAIPSSANGGAHRITLEQAQARARTIASPMAQLAQLQVEAAREARLAAQADYFPKVSSSFLNLHFNKLMGEELTVQHPLLGGSSTLALPLVGKNQTLVAVTAAQPLTPLFKISQVVNIARADERIAMAKAGLPVAEAALNLEKNYYELLIAQRQLAIAKANDQSTHGSKLLASNRVAPGELSASSEQRLETDKAVVIAAGKVKELTGSLNQLLAYPMDTELELVPPETVYQDVSLKEASDRAMVANPEVIEAEQTAVKARAASKLSKLDYVPDLAVLGGYAYQNNVLPLLPADFSFIGVMGTYTLFDFGKREHTLKERNAQVSAAELAVEATKAKVAANIKSSYFALERARQLSELAHRMVSAVQVQTAGYARENDELFLPKAKLEVEMFQADLEYRQALAGLKALVRER